jgi:methyl-accepting chemotaxis protein
MFDDVKLGSKMIGGFLIVAMISTIIGATSLINMRKMAQADQNLYDESTSPLPELSRIAVSVQRMRIASRDFIASQGDAARRAGFKKQISELADDIAKTSDGFGTRNLSPEMRKSFADFK